MKTVRGHFDGNVVVLDEPAPVAHTVMVEIVFPDESDGEAAEYAAMNARFGWDKTRAINDGYSGSVADELIRQRRED